MDKLILNNKDVSSSVVEVFDVNLFGLVIGVIVAWWLLGLAQYAFNCKIEVKSDLKQQLLLREEERRCRMHEAYMREKYEGQALEMVDTKFLLGLGIKVERIFQIYHCVRGVMIHFAQRNFTELYIQLNNLMMQLTGMNSMEFLAKYNCDCALEGLEGFLAKILNDMSTYLKRGEMQDVPYVGNALDGVSDIRGFLDDVNRNTKDWLSFMSSEFTKKLTTLTSLLICVPVLNNFGIKPKLFGYEGKLEDGLRFDYSKHTHLSFMAVMVEHTTWVAMRMCDMYSVMTQHGVLAGVRSLFVSSTDYVLFDTEYLWLKKNSKNFGCRSLVVNDKGEPDAFSLETYRHRCLKALELANKIEISVKHDQFAWNRIRSQKYQIQDYMSECGAAQLINEKRPFPYAIMLTGPPEVGKSFLVKLLFTQMHLSDNETGRFAIPYSHQNIYTRNPNDDFYSGFDSSKTGMLIDDVAQKTPELVKQLAGDDLADLIQIINTIPFLPNQAELKDKGKTPMMIRYFVGTTNTPDLSVQHVFKCPEAVYRRMAFVSVSVKERCRKENSIAIRDDMEPDDFDTWDFTVARFLPTGGSEPIKVYWNGERFVQTSEPIKLDITDLMMFVKADLDRHWTREERTDIKGQTVSNSSVCKHGIKSVLCKYCKFDGQALQRIKVPKWNPYDSVVGENKVSFLQRIVGHLVAYTLYVPITLLILSGYFGTIMFRKPDDKPILPLRCARYLISFIPNYVDIPWVYKLVSIIPNVLVNRSMFLGHSQIKTLFLDNYYTLARPSFTWAEYYKNELVASWCFGFVKAFIGGLMLLSTTRMFMSGEKAKQGQAVEVKMPTATEDEKKGTNHWIKETGIGVFPSKGSTIPEHTLLNQVIMNTVLLKFRCGDMLVTVNGFVVQYNIIITVSHCLDEMEWPDSVEVTYMQDSGQTVTITSKMGQHVGYIVDKDKDLMFIRVDKMNMRRNVLDLLLEDHNTHIKCPGKHIFYDPISGDMRQNNVDMIHMPGQLRYKYKGNVYDGDDCLETCGLAERTTAGMCGSPVIVMQGKNKAIAGIHCAGAKDESVKQGVARMLCKSYIRDNILKLVILPVHKNDTSICLNSNGQALEIVDVHMKCPTHKLKHRELVILGGSTLPRVSPRTQVKRSPICHDVLTHFRKDGYTKITHTSPIDCDPKEAIMLSMSKAVENALFYPDEIDFVVDGFSKEIISKMTKEQFTRLHPYPMSVAINGVDGVPYLERLNLSTSGGYGHPGPKRKLLQQGESTLNHEVNYELTDGLKQEVDWIIEQYENGFESNPVFKCAFKDEPITLEKAEMSKVRIFSGSPVAFSLVVRMYFMCVIREFVGTKRLDFEMAIGANAHGDDWQRIYEKVVTHGHDRVFAGDYKNFDKQMPPEIMLAAFRVIINLFKEAGWNDDNLKVVYGVVADTIHPTMDLFGTLIRCFGSNPSGHVLTTIINSLVNSIYIRLACVRILSLHKVSFDITNFSKIVSLVTYGDDNCGSISANYPMLTHASIQSALGEAGIIYTTDDKKSLSKGLTDISDITFLKRRFVYNDDLERYSAPLLEESLYKSLTVWTMSKTISVQEQLAAVLQSVNREYFFYGRKIFKERNEFLNMVVDKYKVRFYLNNQQLLSYEQILQELKV